jgi:hypothetical protein
MNKNILHFPLIALLYDELPENERLKLLEQIDNNIFLKAEFEELKIAKEMLDKFVFSPKHNTIQALLKKLNVDLEEILEK